MKVGNRVTVRPSSPEAKTRDGYLVSRYDGKRGEVEKVEKDWVLVDGQLVNGSRQGPMEMREWFKPEDLEVG